MPVLFVCFETIDTMAVWLQLLVLKNFWPFIFQPKRLVNIFSV